MDLKVHPPASAVECFAKIVEVLSQAQAGKIQRGTAVEMARQLAEAGRAMLTPKE